MADTEESDPAPHVYGGSDPDSRQPPPANGMRGEGAATPIEPEQPAPDSPNKEGR